MASGNAAIGQGRSTRKAKNPADIALNAGMRPMLVEHGFRRKTKRYFVRETTGAVHYVAISPPDRRVGYLNCMFDASAGIVSKKISNIAQELKLNTKLFIYIKYTDHECHAECQLDDIGRFNGRIDVEKIKRTPLFLRPFTRTPMIYDHIPEMKDFGALCRSIDSSPSSYLASKWAETYAIQHAQLFEKYVLPWFDQCEDMKCLARWIEYWVGRRTKSKNLLLATTCCLASEYDSAKAIFKKILDLPEIPLDKIYKRELRYQKKTRIYKTVEDQRRKAEELAKAMVTRKKQAKEDARALARHFDIDLS